MLSFWVEFFGIVFDLTPLKVSFLDRERMIEIKVDSLLQNFIVNHIFLYL